MSGLILTTTEDGASRIQLRVDGQTVRRLTSGHRPDGVHAVGGGVDAEDLVVGHPVHVELAVAPGNRVLQIPARKTKSFHRPQRTTRVVDGSIRLLSKKVNSRHLSMSAEA